MHLPWVDSSVYRARKEAVAVALVTKIPKVHGHSSTKKVPSSQKPLFRTGLTFQASTFPVQYWYDLMLFGKKGLNLRSSGGGAAGVRGGDGVAASGDLLYSAKSNIHVDALTTPEA